MPIYGQGFPVSKFYTPKEYNGFQQVWKAEQDSNQFLFFGENAVSIFDGVRWQNHHIGYTGRVRSLLRTASNDLYISGQYDFGVLSNDSINVFQIESLAEFRKGYDLNEHISAFENENSIYFYGPRGLEKLYQDSLSISEFENSQTKGFEFNGNVYVSNDSGIFVHNNGEFFYLLNSKNFKGDRLNFAIDYSDEEVLLGFGKSGLFLFDGTNFTEFGKKSRDYIKKSFPFSAVMISDSLVYNGSIYGGLIILDEFGELKSIYNSNSGYTHEGVLGLYKDHESTLWLTLSGGIEKWILGAPLYHYNEKSGIDLEILGILISNSDVFVTSVSSVLSSEIIIPENFLMFFDEQVPIKPNRAMVFDDELYVISRDNRVLKRNDTGSFEVIYYGEVSTFIKNYSDLNSLHYLAYDGIYYYKNGRLNFDKMSNNLNTSMEGIIFNDEIFVNTEDGIYRIKSDVVYKVPIESENPSRLQFNEIDIIDSTIYIATVGPNHEGGLYRYNFDSDSLIKEHKFGDLGDDIPDIQVMTFEQCDN